MKKVFIITDLLNQDLKTKKLGVKAFASTLISDIESSITELTVKPRNNEEYLFFVCFAKVYNLEYEKYVAIKNNILSDNNELVTCIKKYKDSKLDKEKLLEDIVRYLFPENNSF